MIFNFFSDLALAKCHCWHFIWLIDGNDVFLIDCRFISFHTKKLLLLWKSTVCIARESSLTFMRMWRSCVILITSLLVFIYGMHYRKNVIDYLKLLKKSILLEINWIFSVSDMFICLYIGPTMKNLSLLITRFALLEDWTCALAAMTHWNTKWAITLRWYGLERTTITQGVFIIYEMILQL